MKRFKNAAVILASSLLALGVGACNREQPNSSAAADRTGSAYDSAASTADRASSQADRTADAAREKMDQAAASAKEKTERAEAVVEQKAEQAKEAMGDAAITARIKSAFIAEQGLSAGRINVDTVNGTVTLQGSVDSPKEAERAKQIAERVDGVKAVDNRLTVKSSG